jgi:hypothetical protein
LPVGVRRGIAKIASIEPWRAVLPLLIAALSCSGPSESQQAGFYVFGHEVRTFKPCGSDSVFWVQGSPDVHAELRTNYERLATEPYDSIYIRVVGRRSWETASGFAENYDGYWIVTEVLEARRPHPGDCDEMSQ